MASAKGLRPVGYLDCPGGGQVVVQGETAFIGHMRAPHGTSIVDVSDPRRPQRLAGLAMPPGTHSHKVRVANGVVAKDSHVDVALPGASVQAAGHRASGNLIVVADVPSDFVTPTGVYSPNNYNHRFYGPVSLRFALGNSLNVAAIRPLQSAGGAESLHRRLRELGIATLDHSPEYFGLGLTLGNAEVRLLELANAFASLARLGMHQPYRLMLDGGHVDPFDGRSHHGGQAGQVLAPIAANADAVRDAIGL